MFTGSSLTVAKPSLDPKKVNNFIRATAPARQEEKSNTESRSKLTNVDLGFREG